MRICGMFSENLTAIFRQFESIPVGARAWQFCQAIRPAVAVARGCRTADADFGNRMFTMTGRL
jgi:hypothetical protein